MCRCRRTPPDPLSRLDRMFPVRLWYRLAGEPHWRAPRYFRNRRAAQLCADWLLRQDQDGTHVAEVAILGPGESPEPPSTRTLERTP